MGDDSDRNASCFVVRPFYHGSCARHPLVCRGRRPPVVRGSQKVYTGLVANQRYRARVRAVNVSGPGPWRETGYIYTTPAAPINPAYERTTQVELWVTQQAPWAELIRVERSTNSGASWTELGTYGTGRFYDPLPLGSAARYRFRVQTPTPVMQSGYSETLVVNAVLSSDKARMPGVTRIYQEATRIRQVYKGTTRFWTDGEA